ncbi:MAG: hypothetical protein O2856_19635 [Planctomycetota bacterium]|nr:hypothetical protein [Planctomycetota bacterium]
MNFIPSNTSGFIPASHEDPENPGVFKRVIATQRNFQAGQVQMLNWAQLARCFSRITMKTCRKYSCW